MRNLYGTIFYIKTSVLQDLMSTFIFNTFNE